MNGGWAALGQSLHTLLDAHGLAAIAVLRWLAFGVALARLALLVTRLRQPTANGGEAEGRGLSSPAA